MFTGSEDYPRDHCVDNVLSMIKEDANINISIRNISCYLK